MSASITSRSPKDLPDFSSLASLESVSPDAFRSSDKAEQEVCNFVLALALAHNDFKDLLWAFNNISAYKPQKFEVNPVNGQWNGMRLHILKLLYSLVVEVSRLIKEKPKPQQHERFTKAFNEMSAENRKHWNSLYEFAQDTSQDNLMKVLSSARNKISFHYDTKFISQGYEKHFSGKGPEQTRAYASRGSSLRDSRFYFADAAAGAGFGLVESQEKDLVQRLRDIATAIYNLVGRFIQAQGKFAWREE